MDLLDALRTTGAVRAFSPEPVPREALVRVLDAARFAPSGGNRQPWRVVVVEEPERKHRVAELADVGWRQYRAQLQAGAVPFASGDDGVWRGAPVDLAAVAAGPPDAEFVERIATSPALLVVLADLTQLAMMDQGFERTPIVGGASVYPFCWSLLLAARTEGLRGVLTTFLTRAEPEVRALLGAPERFAVAAMLTLGFPAAEPPTRLRRRAVAEFATLDRFDGEPYGV